MIARRSIISPETVTNQRMKMQIVLRSFLSYPFVYSVLFLLPFWNATIFGQEASGRFKVPDEETIKQARARVESAYLVERGKAILSEQRKKLANDYLKTALESEDNKADQFALLEIAAETASSIGNQDITFSAIDAMILRFDVDEIALVEQKLSILEETASSHEKRKMLLTVEKWISKAIQSGKFDSALKLNALESKIATTISSPTAISKAENRKTGIQEAATEHAEYVTAQEDLQHSPDNTNALKIVGIYSCFNLGEWEAGLQILMRTDDATLRRLASTDLDADPDKALLAQGWLSYAEQSSGRFKEGALKRAAYWYQQALPNLTGLNKKLATSNLQSINDQLGVQASPIVSKDTIVEQDIAPAAGNWVTVFPTTASSPKWTIANDADANIRSTPVGLMITSTASTSLQLPVSAESMVVSLDVANIKGNSVYIELRVAGNVGYSFLVTAAGEHTIGKFSGSGFRPMKSVRSSLDRNPFNFQAAVLGSELTLWTNGVKRVSVRDESIKGDGNIRVGAFGVTNVTLSAAKYLIPTEDQIVILSGL